ncbi:hypothetical protein QAD02_021553 [Eretmocerus hayati]|uniref:Uncharacterized protein n=1 Tax=Eretmocerus hayati TaxID=131215 RepID=A0ACC2PQS5_9HYME|nr:hypothetical protein QAD02_021553 [Eretmocerus hayati]
MSSSPTTLENDLNTFLRQYRRAPHSSTGVPPSQLFLGRNIRTRLDQMRPGETQRKMNERIVAEFDPSFRIFQARQTVHFRSGNPKMDPWVAGTVIRRIGDLYYEIDHNGKIFKRHVDQMR